MKKSIIILMLAFGAIFFTSCDKTPDNKINSTKTEEAGWVVKNVGEKPVMGYDTLYQISPNWGQSNYYASKRDDYKLHIILGSISFILFLLVFYGKASSASWLPKRLDEGNLGNIVLFILLVTSVYFYFGNASSIKWNNNKWVKKELYDNVMKSGSTQPIWDSLENNCLIVDGPYNCYK